MPFRAGGGADHGGRGRDRDAPGEEAPRDSLMEHWCQGYSRPGARVYSDFVGCIRSGDLLEAVILDTAHVERGNVLCEVIGQGIGGSIHKSITCVSVLTASETDLLAWAVPNLSAPGCIHLCESDARDEDLCGAEAFLQAVGCLRLRDRSKLDATWNRHLRQEDTEGMPRQRAGADDRDRRAGGAAGDRGPHGAQESRDATPEREDAERAEREKIATPVRGLPEAEHAREALLHGDVALPDGRERAAEADPPERAPDERHAGDRPPMRPEVPAPPPAPRPGRVGGADRPAAGPAAEGLAFPPDLPGGLVPGPRAP